MHEIQRLEFVAGAAIGKRGAMRKQVIQGMPRFCEVKGCNENVRTNRYCQAHQYSKKLYGNPLKLKKPRVWSQRFKSDNLRSVSLPEGLACALATMFRRLP